MSDWETKWWMRAKRRRGDDSLMDGKTEGEWRDKDKQMTTWVEAVGLCLRDVVLTLSFFLSFFFTAISGWERDSGYGNCNADNVWQMVASSFLIDGCLDTCARSTAAGPWVRHQWHDSPSASHYWSKVHQTQTEKFFFFNHYEITKSVFIKKQANALIAECLSDVTFKLFFFFVLSCNIKMSGASSTPNTGPLRCTNHHLSPPSRLARTS